MRNNCFLMLKKNIKDKYNETDIYIDELSKYNFNKVGYFSLSHDITEYPNILHSNTDTIYIDNLKNFLSNRTFGIYTTDTDCKKYSPYMVNQQYIIYFQGDIDNKDDLINTYLNDKIHVENDLELFSKVLNLCLKSCVDIKTSFKKVISSIHGKYSFIVHDIFDKNIYVYRTFDPLYINVSKGHFVALSSVLPDSLEYKASLLKAFKLYVINEDYMDIISEDNIYKGKEKNLLLLSGGLCSSTLMYHMLNLKMKFDTLHVGYNRGVFKAEKQPALALTKLNDIKLNYLDIRQIYSDYESIPYMDYFPDKPEEIPNKHVVLYSIAMMYAKLNNYNNIFIASDSDSRNSFHDYILNHLNTQSCVDFKVGIVNPFKYMNRNDIFKKALEYEVPLNLTMNCLNPVHYEDIEIKKPSKFRRKNVNENVIENIKNNISGTYVKCGECVECLKYKELIKNNNAKINEVFAK